MNLIFKKIRLTLFLALSAVMSPAFSADVDATMLEYTTFEPNEIAVAEAVIVNRSNVALPYIIEAINLQGDVLEVLKTGTLIAGEIKKVSGKGANRNQGVVRIKVGDASTGLGAEDVIYLRGYGLTIPPAN